MTLLRISNRKALSILEQAAFLDELQALRHLSVAEIAAELSRKQVLGEHAFGPSDGDEPGGAGSTL